MVARTPAFGYADHPPIVAWWIWLSTRFLGDTALGIRMPSILAALATSLAVFGTAHQLFSEDSIGLRAVLWFNAQILIGVGTIFSTPDGPSTLFWALSLLGARGNLADTTFFFMASGWPGGGLWMRVQVHEPLPGARHHRVACGAGSSILGSGLAERDTIGK
jgi:4-amino-4-deoxy-L-arabinose transferase-like glycosyltransferase